MAVSAKPDAARDLGSGILGLSDPPGFKQAEQAETQHWHAAGCTGAWELCSGKFGLTSHASHCERKHSQPVYAREQRHAIIANPSVTC